MYIVAANAHGNGNLNAINLNLNGARVKRTWFIYFFNFSNKSNLTVYLIKQNPIKNQISYQKLQKSLKIAKDSLIQKNKIFPHKQIKEGQ